MTMAFGLPGFPDSSVGKESACNAGHPSLIPGSGRSLEERIGCPLHYPRASLVAQLVKNPPAMRETWVQFLGWEDPLEKRKATPSRYSGLENSMDYPWGPEESDMTEWLLLHLVFQPASCNCSAPLPTSTQALSLYIWNLSLWGILINNISLNSSILVSVL